MRWRKAVCQKRPWGLNRLLRKRRGETGIIIHGWFPRVNIYGPVEWSNVSVRIPYGPEGLVSQTAHRVLWLPVAPGHHEVMVGIGRSGASLIPQPHVYSVSLELGQVALLVFSTPRWTPSGRFRRPVWCPPVLVSERA